MEIWKDIPDYEGIYQASNYGDIRTKPNKTTFTERHGIRHWKTRVLKGRGNNKITGKRASLWKNGKPKDWLVARLVAITFLGKPQDDCNTVNHINGNRFDNRIENLEWLSLGDNVRHSFETGLHTNVKPIILKNRNQENYFYSLSKASQFLNQNTGYISKIISQNKKIAYHKNGTPYLYDVV